MNRRTWAYAVLAWMGVVIVGSALTWLAIDRAGQQVTSSTVFSDVTPSPTPTATPHPSHHPSKKARPKHSATPERTQVPVTPTPVTPVAPAPKPQLGTWSGAGGSVTVSCQGQTVRLVGASPNTGWQVERGDSVGDSVEVKFSKNATQIQVHATCSRGVPAFQAETSGGTGTDN